MAKKCKSNRRSFFSNLRFVIFVLAGLAGSASFAQVVADFSVQLSACINENIPITNLSANAVTYEWDFCSGDLQNAPPARDVITHSTFNKPSHITFVSDFGQWYGFVVNRFGSSITRLDFGSSLSGTPIAVDLGSFGGLFTQPIDIEFVKSGQVWYALVIDASTNKLWRGSFASLEDKNPVFTPMTTFNNAGLMDIPVDLEILQDQNEVIALITNYYGSALSKATFGNTILNDPTGVNIPIPAALNLQGISALKQGANWKAYTTATTNSKVFMLTFSSGLSGNPTIEEQVPSGISITSPMGIDVVDDNAVVYGFVQSTSGDVYRLNDAGTTTPTGVNLGNLPTSSSANEGIKLVKIGTEWFAFMVNINSNTISRVHFPSSCSADVPISTLQNPLYVKYSAAGSYNITLRSIDQFKNESLINKTINVSSQSAPEVSFSSQNICANYDVVFTVQTVGAISNYTWSFGDATNSSTANPIHQYANSGEYGVSLKVTSGNGCHNTVSENLKIYTKPASGYISPTGLICTNNEFTFTNTTVDNFDGNLSYQWLVDNVLQSTSRDLKYAFATGGNKEVKLITSIPGCADEHVQLINNVLTGPTVGFNMDGKCEGVTVNFTNTSSGDITGYEWDSGNGQTSMATNFTNNYPTKGTYNVSLKTTANNGCVSTMVKPLTIYSQPQPNFSLDLPPFSCSGTPSQFNDLTPNPTDSNLASWAWNFGDAGTSTERNPLHTFTTAGNYNVSLTATTNFGCSGSFQKSVTIAPSPPADFTFTPACINQGTRFTDASGSGVKSWLWTIGGSTYAFSNPTHVFGTSGSYTAKLTVTGNNSCVATVTKTIHVPVAPSLSFSVDNACEKQAANFKDTTPVTTDPAVSWAWDFAGQATASGSAVPYSFAKAGSYVVKMTSTQQSGCVYSLSKNVTINTTPVAAFTSSPEWGVPPLSVQFTNTSTGANSYLWHFNDKTNSTSTQASPTFQFTDLGGYVVDLMATSASGCSSTASGKISVVIPSLDLELKQLQVVKDPASNGYRIFVTVKNKSNYLLTSVDVVVDISGNALIKETINTSLAPDAEVVQLLNNQILPHGNLLTYLCASVEVDNDDDPFNNSKCEPIEEETVVFNPFPNPSNGSFRFQWISPATDMAHFEIFNSMGQLAFEQYAESVQVGLNQVQFDLRHLNTGAYYFRFSSGSISKTLPVQIVR